MRPTTTEILPKIGDKVQIKLWTFPYLWVDGEVVEPAKPYTGPEENVKNCLDSGTLIWVRYAGGEVMVKSISERIRHVRI